MKAISNGSKWLLGLWCAAVIMAPFPGQAKDYTLTITPAASPVAEDVGTATFDATLVPPAASIAGGDPDEVVVFDLSFTDGSAVAPDDYTATATPMSLSFSPGEDTVSFTVPIIDDLDIEPDEDFGVVATFNGGVSTPSAKSPGSPFNGSISIVSNDHEITLTTEPFGKITLNGTVIADGSGGTGVSTSTIVATGDLPGVLFETTSPCYYIADAQIPGESITIPPNSSSLGHTYTTGVSADQTISLAVAEYGITTEVFGNGTISPSGGACSAGPTNFLVEAEPGYHIDWIRVDGIEIVNYDYPWDETKESYDLLGVVPTGNDVLVEAAFTQRIEITDNSPFGRVMPPGDPFDYDYGGEPYVIELNYEEQIPLFEIFTIDHSDNGEHTTVPGTADKHHISNIIVDGTPVDFIQGMGLAYYDLQIQDYDDPGTPTILESLIRTDHTVEVLFTSFVDVHVVGPGRVVYTNDSRDPDQEILELPVTPATNPGSIEVEAPHAAVTGVDSDAILTLVPDLGYHINSVMLDGANIGLGSEVILSDMLVADHELEVSFSIDSFVVEPTSKYNTTIFNDQAESSKATVQNPTYGQVVDFYIKLNHPINGVEAVIIDNLPVDIPDPGDNLVDINGEWEVTNNAAGTQLHVTFPAIQASHRLEVIDYDASPIHDVPLAASSIAAPANLMFLFDDSGSMNWSVMTTSGSQGRYYINGTGYTGVFNDYQIPAAYRMQWKSQWYEYNRMYYNPSVEYLPWPRVVKLSQDIASGTSWDSRTQADADLAFPRLHPLDSSSTLDLFADFTVLGGAQDIVVDDNGVNGYDGFYVCQEDRDSGQGGVNNDYREIDLDYCTGSVPPYATWVPSIPEADQYEVFVTWQGESDSFHDVCYTVHHEGGSIEKCDGDGLSRFDHTIDINPPNWVSLGIYDFAVQNYWDTNYTSRGRVTISSVSNGVGSDPEFQADAVRFRKVDSQNVVIPYAHYYTWSTEAGAPYLVIFNNATSQLDYYRAVGTNVENGVTDHDDMITSLTEVTGTWDATAGTGVPPDVLVTDTYQKALQNFANWVTYYHERRLAAISASSRALVLMEGTQVGLSAINSNSFQLPVQPIKVNGVDKTDAVLEYFYTMPASGGTPLRRALEDVGDYFDATDTESSKVGWDDKFSAYAPWASAEEGGECQQTFTILMTDGFWNSDGASNTVEDADDNYRTDIRDAQGHTLYADSDEDTLGDVALYYYNKDLVDNATLANGADNSDCSATHPCLDNNVVGSPEDTLTNHDPATWQHMVTFAVSFGLEGTLNHDYFMDPAYNRLHVDSPNPDYPDWPNVSSNSQETVDDMLHAGINGRGGFHSASTPDELVQALVDIVANISKRTGSAASVSVNGDELFEVLGADTRMFQSIYNTDTWWGDLKSYGLDITTNQFSIQKWSAIDKMDTFLADTTSGGFARRKIYTNANGGKTFDWANLTDLQKAHLDPYFASGTILTGANVVNYIKGDDSHEGTNLFRDRVEPFGDFVHSQAVYEDGNLYLGGNDGMLHVFRADDANGGEEVMAYIPSFVYPNLRELANPSYKHKYFVDSTPYVEKIIYFDSPTSTIERSLTVLYGGLGKGGKGIYALDISDPENFTPATDVMWEYPELTSIPSPRNTITFVDGGQGNRDEIRDSSQGFTGLAAGDFISVVGADCSVTPAGTNSKTFEVLEVSTNDDIVYVEEGSLLDSCGDNNTIYILETPDVDVGYTFGTPILVNTNDSTINSADPAFQSKVLIFPNGYSSPSGEAVLYVMDPKNGTVLRKINTHAGPFNGLSSVKVIDVDNNLRADHAYAGDLLGNMWKFDLSSTNRAEWQVAYCQKSLSTATCSEADYVAGRSEPKPLFSANTNQPITGAPDIMFHPEQRSTFMVIFGTGKYLSTTDLSNTDVQSMYGIWDWAGDEYDGGYLGSRVDDTSSGTPVALLSHAPMRDASNDPVNTLLRQETWVEGELTEDVNGNGLLDIIDEDTNKNGILDPGEDLDGDNLLDVDEDTNGNGFLDTYSYYRIPTNYQPDWTMTEATFDVNGDGIVTTDDLIPEVHVGWYYDLPGKILNNDTIDNDLDGTIDEDNDGDYDQYDEHGLGERITSDAIIRDGKAILLSFGMTNSVCSAGTYSFVNERDANTGGMTGLPVFDITGANPTGAADGEVDGSDFVYIGIDTDGDGVKDIIIPGNPTDKAFDGHLFNPAILRKDPESRPPEEIKYFSSSSGQIESLTEAGERRGIYYWLQSE